MLLWKNLLMKFDFFFKDQHQRCDLKDANEFIRTEETLELIVRPERNQRARRENELLKDLRYVAGGENDGMTLRVSHVESSFVFQCRPVIFLV